MSAKKEEIDEFDLERGPEDLGLQRLGTDEFRELQAKDEIAQSRERGFEKVRRAEAIDDADDFKFFEKGPYEARKGIEELREKGERSEMLGEDNRKLYESEMKPLGQEEEKGGRRRKTHRKKNYKKKTYKKHRKTSRKHKKRSSKRSTKRCKK
jgi:hypothetical protein